ncbi:MAG: 2-dehydro-3-deoxy-D-gluconate 5-dehydrogenase KduD [Rhodothermales bacterium]
MNGFSLQGRVALVTGASRGLGRAIAIALGQAGADVVCASTSRDGTNEAANEIRSAGAKSWQVGADLSDERGVEAMIAEVESEVEAVDILVNNAGTIRRHPAVDYPMDDWNVVLQTNLNATFMLCQRFGKRMVDRGSGKIINVASLLSFTGGITVPAYTASKHAVAGLTKALANEWAQHNVQVNAIAPGYFRTDNTQALQDDENRSRAISDRIPAGRWGEPEDLGGAAVFLASPASNYVNGHILVVDGGWTAR